MSQQWEDLLFLHWATESAPLATKLPAELEIDLYQGQAWLSVVGFRLTNLRIKPFTKIPWKDFCEVNLRTYVKDSAGRCGVWFFFIRFIRLIGCNCCSCSVWFELPCCFDAQ